MDHMMIDHKFILIGERLGYKSNARILPKILSLLLTEIEANVLLLLPSSEESLVLRSGLSKQEVLYHLEALYMKGFIMEAIHPSEGNVLALIRNYGETIYGTPMCVRHGTYINQLWLEWQVELENNTATHADAGQNVAGRILPINSSRSTMNPIPLHEDVSSLIENAHTIAVAPCKCRSLKSKCDSPTSTCIFLNEAAVYFLSISRGERVTKEQAHVLIGAARDHGLIQTTTNSKHVDMICNCCSCCCYFHTLFYKSEGKCGLIPSGYTATVDPEKCIECQSCLAQCHFNAVSISVDGAIVIDASKCMGCGLCTVGCGEGAISIVKNNHHHEPANAYFPFINPVLEIPHGHA